jgi:hypothetical protein
LVQKLLWLVLTLVLGLFAKAVHLFWSIPSLPYYEGGGF